MEDLNREGGPTSVSRGMIMALADLSGQTVEEATETCRQLITSQVNNAAELLQLLKNRLDKEYKDLDYLCERDLTKLADDGYVDSYPVEI